jgi:hypothetical protein
MKHIIKLLLLIFVPALMFFCGKSFGQENGDTLTFRTLHNELDTAGEWIKVTQEQIDSSGIDDALETALVDNDVNTEYIWRPNYAIMDPEWNPYHYGRWQRYQTGWAWVSYYSWGWLPYHYGRWWYSPIWGWVWSPGRTWAPCWVSWWWDDGYVGWQPISPRHHWRWHHGCIVTHHRPHKKRIHEWNFVKKSDFTKEMNKGNLVDLKTKEEIVVGVKDGDDLTKYDKGPDVKSIEASTGEKIATKKIKLVDNESGNVSSFNDTKTTVPSDNTTNKDDTKYEKKDDTKYEKKDDTKYEKKDDTKYEKKDDTKYEKKDDTKYEKKDDTKYEKKDDTKYEKKDDTKYEKKDDTKYEKKDDTKYEKKESKSGNNGNEKNTKSESKSGNKSESKSGNKSKKN